jgi:hypothetical protein
MSTVARLQNDGDLLLTGEIDERSPMITNGLVHNFPFDDSSGAFDHQGGVQTLQNIESGANLFDAMKLDWRNPDSWFVTSGNLNNVSWDEEKQALRVQGNNYLWFDTPIVVDPSKRYAIEAEVFQENDEMASTSATRLYLGGRGFTESRVNYTPNYDYSMSAGYSLPLGQWKRFGVIRSGTSVMTNSTRMLNDGEDPVATVGWSSDNGLCYKFHFGGLFNYYGSSNAVAYIKNISIVILDDDTSNTSITSDGIGVGETTTNLANEPDKPDTWYSADDPLYGFISQRVIDTPFGIKGLSKTVKTSGNDYRATLAQVYTNASSITSTDRVTQSIYARTTATDGGGYMNLNFQGVDSTGARQDYTLTFRLTNEWARYDVSMLLSDHGMSSIIDTMKIYLYCNDGLERTFEIACPQLEKKPYATPFVIGSRSSSSKVDIEVPRMETYTVFGKFVPYSPLENGSTYDTTQVSSSLIRIEDTLKVGGFFYRFYLMSGTTSSPYFDPDGYYNPTTGSAHIHNNYEILKRYPVYFAIRKSGTTAKIKLFQNGAWKSEHVATVPADAGVDLIRLGSTAIWNGSYSDLSIYNRELSDNELDTLAKGRMSVSQEGSITKTSIAESPNDILASTKYFPLGEDGNDYNKVVSPRNNTAVYEDGVAWVGESATNNIANPLTWTGWDSWDAGQREYIGEQVVNGEICTIVRIKERKNVETTGTTNALYKTFTLSGGSNTFSFYARVSPNSPLDTGIIKPYITSYGTSPLLNKHEWKRVIRTESTASTSSTLHITQDNKDCYVDVALPQLEYKGFATPFVDGTRPQNSLSYTSSDLTSSEYKDFSFATWIKYTDQSTWQLSGDWGRWYFGAYANNRLQFSWLENSANTGNVSSQRSIPASLSSNIPKNQWVHIGVTVKENASIKIYYNGELILDWSQSFYLTNPMVSFELNSLDNSATYPLNAYVRDMMFVDKAVSPEEMKAIYKNKLRDGNSLQVQGKIKEGVML